MMRKTILLFAVAVAFTACKESATTKFEEDSTTETVAVHTGTPKLTVDNQMHDFGDLNLNDRAEHTFTIKDAGTPDLVILQARPSCGWTVPDNYTDTPIDPGETRVDPIIFNATSAGPQATTVTLTPNTESGSVVLTIKGGVKAYDNDSGRNNRFYALATKFFRILFL